MVHSHVSERRHVKLLYDGTVAKESDALRCEEPHPWSDLIELKTLSRTAEKHAQVNTDCSGALVPGW